jgi:1,2-diacylglycerol 3-beta-galactosyltransferase
MAAHSDRKRVLILTVDAGFGHRSAANAVAAAFEDAYGEVCVVEVVNPLNEKNAPALLRGSQKEYDTFVRRMPDFYKLNYQFSDTQVPAVVIENALLALMFPTIRSLIKRFEPSVILTTHVYYIASLNAYITLRKRDIPSLTVVTDLTDVHRLWFHQGADLCLLPTQEAYQQALASGIPPERAQVTGIPVNPAFANETRSKDELRRALGWKPGLTTALVVGSKRVRNLMNALHLFNHSGLPLQFVLVAGGDDKLFDQFKATQWHAPAYIYNYVTNMPQLMRAADLVIGKAGGLSVSESLACGLPLLMVDVTPGQEEGNAAYVVRNGAGEHANQPVEGLEILCHWLEHDQQLLQERAANACALGHPCSAYTIADLAWQAAEHGRAKPTPRQHELVPRLKEVLRAFDINISDD